MSVFLSIVTLGILAAPAGVIAHDEVVPPWRGQPGSSFQEWTFATDANPAAPDPANNPFGSPSASITPGAFASGWLSDLFGLGSQTGLWDIGGEGGRIRITVPNAACGAGYTDVQVQVAYLDDITQAPIVTVTGAAWQSAQTLVVEPLVPTGSWSVDQSVWRINACPAELEIVIESIPEFGSVIDQIVVDAIAVSSSASCGSPPQDINHDGSVDTADYDVFSACFNGTGNPVAAGCECFDAEGDGDVDGADFGVFSACFNGSGNPPNC